MSEPTEARKESSQFGSAVSDIQGLIQDLLQAQSQLPRAVTAQEQLISTVLSDQSLTRQQKGTLLQTVANAWDNSFCITIDGQPSPDKSAQDAILSRFAHKLARHSPWFSAVDIESLREAGFDDAAILAAVATTATGQMICTLAKALLPDSAPGTNPPVSEESSQLSQPEEKRGLGPYLKAQPPQSADFAPYMLLSENLGFIPNLFRVQSSWPDLIATEVQALDQILFTEDILSRSQKENILLVISAANLNTYFVALSGQTQAALGAASEDVDQIVEDHLNSSLSPADKALLTEFRKLAATQPVRARTADAALLQQHGFTKPQVLEAVAMAAITNFFNTLQAGLGPPPDFPPRRVFTTKDLYLSGNQVRPIPNAPPPDPDAALVARIQSGDVDAFEELVRRHTRRVFGVLSGLVGNVEDARDAVQDVFMKAFEHIHRFEGRSKFSTWLVSIAINTGTESLRRRKPSAPLEELDDEDGFRPRQIQSWADNPEQLVSASQRSHLVREAVLRLPEKYRVVVLLRDINQLSTEDAAAALGLGIPALKARLLRGRLMLRESLAPHFIPAEKDGLEC